MTISRIRCLMICPISKISTQTTTDVVDHHIHVSKTHANMTNMHDSYIVHARYASVIHTSLSLQQNKQQTSTQQLPPSRVSDGFSLSSTYRKRNPTNELIGLVQIINTTAFAPGSSSQGCGVFVFATPPHKVVDFSPLTNQIDPRNKQQTIDNLTKHLYIYIFYIHSALPHELQNGWYTWAVHT